MTKIAVAALTCRRPRMLARLLESYERLKEPEGVEVLYLIVDNAPDAPVAADVAAWQRKTRKSVIYVIEPEPGIPYGRNRALDEAIAHGADWLTFVDDDETVDPGWLDAIVAHERRERSHLVGPVRPSRRRPSSALERLVFNGARPLPPQGGENAAAAPPATMPASPSSPTTGWATSPRRAGVLYRPPLHRGSDTALYHAARRAGAKPSWCPEAIVYEEVPRERISFAYQFARARDQAATSYLRKQADERRNVVSAVAAIVGKFIVGTVLVAAGPCTGGRTLVDGARSFGWGVGYGYALAGRKSRHYEALQGD